jgi:membrane-bound lytic murein transglycosylase D
VADSAGSDLASIVSANAQYRKHRAPPDEKAGKWRVRVPDGKGVRATRTLKRREPHPGLTSYRARFGDTLESIASDHGMSASRLASVNKLGRTERILSGTTLLVDAAGASKGPAEPETFVVPPTSFNYPQRREVLYRVRHGDSLASIATAFGVSRTDLSTWNAVDEQARLQDGMGLRVFVENDNRLSRVRHYDPKDCRVLTLGTKEFYDHFESLNGKQRLVVSAREGDTLESVGKRYGMSVGSMERVNRRSRRDMVEPGQRLVVYTARGAQDLEASEAPAPLPAVLPSHPELLPGADWLKQQ